MQKQKQEKYGLIWDILIYVKEKVSSCGAAGQSRIHNMSPLCVQTIVQKFFNVYWASGGFGDVKHAQALVLL